MRGAPSPARQPISEWPLLAQSGLSARDEQCPLLGGIVLQNSQNALRPISHKYIKRAEIANRYSLQAATEVACYFIAMQYDVVPQMIIRSPNIRPGEFAIGDAKRLLRQYRGGKRTLADRLFGNVQVLQLSACSITFDFAIASFG
jgi:hypothetical protein